jgi:hypothetical protein
LSSWHAKAVRSAWSVVVAWILVIAQFAQEARLALTLESAWQTGGCALAAVLAWIRVARVALLAVVANESWLAMTLEAVHWVSLAFAIILAP